MKSAIIYRIIIYGFILFVLVVWRFSYILTHTTRMKGDFTPAGFNLTYENVKFKTSDGLELAGWFIPVNKPKGLIILCHGIGADKSDLVRMAPFLYHGGYSVFIFDFRSHGDSSGKYTSMGYYERQDLNSAIDYLKLRKDCSNLNIGVYGFSMGASIAYIVSSENKEIKAVIGDSGFVSAKDIITRYANKFFHIPKYPLVPIVIWVGEKWIKCKYSDIDAIKYIEKISPRPVLIIHGEKDENIPVDDARKLFEKAREPKELWIIPNAGHTETYSTMQSVYEQKIIDFFNKNL
ncbi:MAG: alpha/beta hydrolase [Candidatus Firestonebacteria bacterium]